jgi:S-formylglutathione hydrolase FrmB
MRINITAPRLIRALTAAALAFTLAASNAQAQATPHVFFRVTLATSAPGPVSGRLLVFLKKGTGDKEVNIQEFHPADTSVAAQEVHDLAPGASIEIDADTLAYPKPFSTLPSDDYEVQGVLDPDHTYNYSGRNPSDWITPVLALTQWKPGTSEPTLTLDAHAVANPQRAEAATKARSDVKPGVIEEQQFVSPLLTHFSGNPTSIKAWVVLPPGYEKDASQQYPTVYYTHGFGGSLDGNLVAAATLRARMDAGTMPPMIWVMLDESIPEGTHEFADSVNNGPWGTALTTEFIPMLEQKYRMDAKSNGRFLNGHSSGGWATLQLQINFPQVFGGTWSTSPDPSDFHNFTGPDLYAPHANVFHRPDGTPFPIMRVDGKVVATFEQFTKIEAVLGPYGGQITSFDWVFSPRAKSGTPKPMFDHLTGDVDPTVVAYWHDHYDLAHLVEEKWPTQAALLKGRIHLFVGTADTFYLDSSAHLFDARLAKLGADAHFTYIPDRSHFDLYRVGTDQRGLFDQIAKEMYAVARPGVTWKKPN